MLQAKARARATRRATSTPGIVSQAPATQKFTGFWLVILNGAGQNVILVNAMNLQVAVPAALGAAAFFAVGTAMQYRAARQLDGQAPAGGHLDRAEVVRVARASLRSASWVLGTAILALGLALHVLALHEAPLSLVQPLLVCGVLFTLPASKRAGGPPITRSDMGWAALLVGFLAVFLVTATPVGAQAKEVDRLPAAAGAGVGLALVALCVLVARRREGAWAAGLLGTAAGVALAAAAALIKVCSDLALKQPGQLVAGWPLYALLVVGALAMLLTQLSYRAGPMVVSVPVINTINPLASVVIGTAVFDERFRVGLASSALEGLSLAGVLLAAAALSRRSASRRAQGQVPAGAA